MARSAFKCLHLWLYWSVMLWFWIAYCELRSGSRLIAYQPPIIVGCNPCHLIHHKRDMPWHVITSKWHALWVHGHSYSAPSQCWQVSGPHIVPHLRRVLQRCFLCTWYAVWTVPRLLLVYIKSSVHCFNDPNSQFTCQMKNRNGNAWTWSWIWTAVWNSKLDLWEKVRT